MADCRSMSSMSTLSEIPEWILKTAVGEPLAKGSRDLRNQDGFTEAKSCQISNFISFLDTVTSQGDEVCTDS